MNELKNTSDVSVSIDNVSINSLIRQKVVFVGDVSVGKTSIITRFIENKFKEIYDVSIYYMV